MRILVINPNSTASMTDGIVAAAREAAAPDVEIEGMTNSGGPPAIQGEEDGRAATPGVVAACAAAGATHDAVIIACFDDTGLAEARAASSIPVIGIGHAAFLTSMVHGGRFSVITTLQVSVPVIERNIQRYGLVQMCARVRASGLPVLCLEDDPGTARTALVACAKTAAEEDDASALVLGCAGMASFGAAMQKASGLPAVDGVAAAVGLARTATKA